MKVLVLDYETYYSDDYTLSRMTTEEYVRDPRFEIIGVAFGYLGEQPRWYSGTLEYIRSVLAQLPWHDIICVGHNMSAFDALILTEVCGVRPAYYGCTLQLARRVHGGKTPDGKVISNALGSLARMYALPLDKGDEVVHAKGKRLADFTPWQLDAYGKYCIKDVQLCGMLWQKLSVLFPMSELKLASLVTKMWAEPRLVLDTPLLDAMRTELLERKAALLADVADMLGINRQLPEVERLAATQKVLRSDAKFASLLKHLNVDIPMKPSPKKRDAEGKALQVYAFAKTDEGMTNLAEYEEQDDAVNLMVQTLATARLGTKSTQAEGRVERFLGISKRGKLPVPYAYGKSHCDRLAGSQSINLQNMNRIKGVTPKTPNGSLIMTDGGWSRLAKRKLGVDRNGRPMVVAVMDAEGRVWNTDPAVKDPGVQAHVIGLRDTIMAPPGYRLVVADSSNIELRTCHHLCGQEDSIALLRAGGDLYCDFATSFYGRLITKLDEAERQHGKTAELQLQFQSGPDAFRRAARIMSGVKLTEAEAKATVDIYRARRQKIVQKWKDAQKFIPLMAKGGGFYLDQWGHCFIEHNAIRLPNGMRMQYHNLRQEELLNFDGIPELTWVYDDKEDRKLKKLYGGKIVQNSVQALARNVVFEQKLLIEKELGSYERYGEGIVMSTHDEPAAIVREDRADEALKLMLEIMHQSPAWWPSLPVKAEGGHGVRYSEAK